MSYAAAHRKIFHLWWHPHNFGAKLDNNLSFLKKIMKHYESLQRSYQMQSLHMGELAELGSVEKARSRENSLLGIS